jgi:hypothetical protein
MPKTSPYRVFHHEQPAEFLDRNTVCLRPFRRRSGLQGLAASAPQLLRNPCRYLQSMGATVRMKTGIFHNVIGHK